MRKREGQSNGRLIPFAIPILIIVCCPDDHDFGTVTLVRMPVDLFPPSIFPVVVVATFYSGMPPQQIEAEHHQPV